MLAARLTTRVAEAAVQVDLRATLRLGLGETSRAGLLRIDGGKQPGTALLGRVERQVDASRQQPSDRGFRREGAGRASHNRRIAGSGDLQGGPGRRKLGLGKRASGVRLREVGSGYLADVVTGLGVAHLLAQDLQIFGGDRLLGLGAAHIDVGHDDRLQNADLSGAKDLPAFSEFLKRNEPLCGRLQADKLDALFGAHAAEARSTVLMPIDGIGMLAIGSGDANRFHPGMGTVFLKLIGEAIAAAVARFG